jgi:hypothetical protein
MQRADPADQRRRTSVSSITNERNPSLTRLTRFAKPEDRTGFVSDDLL